eukprot:2870865-Prymnesium_polylepis.1
MHNLLDDAVVTVGGWEALPKRHPDDRVQPTVGIALLKTQLACVGRGAGEGGAACCAPHEPDCEKMTRSNMLVSVASTSSETPAASQCIPLAVQQLELHAHRLSHRRVRLGHTMTSSTSFTPTFLNTGSGSPSFSIKW